MTFLTTEKSAETFAKEIYEERESITILEPTHLIEITDGLRGYATRFAYNQEVVEEITLDLPGEHHSLLHLRFWHPTGTFDEELYVSAKADILTGIQKNE